MSNVAVLGEISKSSLSVIAQFKNDEWSLYGNLRQSRGYHGSITYGTQTLVIGGWTSDTATQLLAERHSGHEIHLQGPNHCWMSRRHGGRILASMPRGLLIMNW